MKEDHRISRLRDAGEDVRHARETPDTPQGRSPSYRLAYADTDFLLRDDLRPVRLMLELQKPEVMLTERGIESTVILFGSARVPAPDAKAPPNRPSVAKLTKWYDEAQRFARAVSARALQSENRDFVICTGGGPGIMEAGNRGAADAGGISIGLNIVLPHEQEPNPYVTPDLAFNFHYFAIRKMHFLMRARALAVFPGGLGTLDEMFEAITLIQTGRMNRIPVLLFNRDYWERLIDWQVMVDAGTVAAEDLKLISFVETTEEALAIMDGWNGGAGC
ncbi:LOG family protein [Acidimangrovimonas sediminis]|uniref:LOG family protein n=1 Tax=Acidimangrovimonas sediminis TaxID=2056283 RepID=UPI000C80745F|nr:TIGR00730 family Rossman fold protein [Acidimangrovimonas sediminis]